MINIELKDRNRTKEFSHKLQDKAEEIMFFLIQKIPERLIPNFFMVWLDGYVTRRIAELKQQSIKAAWQNMYLQQAVDEIQKSK